MIFSETKLKGAYVIDIKKEEDERGFFARTWDKEKFFERGLKSEFVQFSMSFNKKKGTLRGMHYQIEPFEETKLISCVSGKIYDVIIDLRKFSPTYKKWMSIELSDTNHRTLYVPKGFAHGYITLKNNTLVTYKISEKYNPKFARGIKWDDIEFKIKWPINPIIISKKDQSFNNWKTN